MLQHAIREQFVTDWILITISGPFFDGCPANMVLDRTDCTLVQVIHTSAERVRTIGPLRAQFGTNRKSGHCDYWINCGSSQYPCSGSSVTEILSAASKLELIKSAKAAGNMTGELACSHGRSHDAYISQLTRSCDLRAQSCLDASGRDTCDASKDCNTNGPDVGFSLIPDAHCDPSMNHNFYVGTKRAGQGAKLC